MKTIRLSTILVSTVLFFGAISSTLSADTSTVKVTETKEESQKSDLKKFGDARFIPKTNKDTNWTRKSYDDEYQRGKIRTH